MKWERNEKFQKWMHIISMKGRVGEKKEWRSEQEEELRSELDG